VSSNQNAMAEVWPTAALVRRLREFADGSNYGNIEDLQEALLALADDFESGTFVLAECLKSQFIPLDAGATEPPAASLRDLLKPIELDELIEWHKMCASCCERSDDLAGARRHRERRVELVGIRAGDAPTKEAPHDEHCDVNDPIIKGKPCNCRNRVPVETGESR
jgi:hypothetical protein